ncbi:MAG: hypothetical protein CM15mP46_2320 [Alphaproteobacteria bacterium]|nr:MAG: hypothetical protein CM15mP46_2320 [Alphaproteobacteria bacterium]
MHYYSTRGQDGPLGYEDALLSGLARMAACICLKRGQNSAMKISRPCKGYHMQSLPGGLWTILCR